MSKTNWLREDQKFKLKYGKSNNNWESVILADGVTTADLHDGVYLTENSEGKFGIATDGQAPAYPMLEEKYGYDNQAVGGVTISVGTVLAFTKHFDGTPSKGDKLKIGATAGKLAIADIVGDDTEDMVVAVVTAAHDDYIEIQKKY